MSRSYKNLSIANEANEMLDKIKSYRENLKPVKVTKRDIMFELVEKEYKKLPKEAK